MAVTQQQAWEALNDPEILKACIPGCDRMEVTADNQLGVGVALKIGPVAARFSGKVILSDVQPPDSYTLSFDGQGGAAGFGKGQSQVRLQAGADGRGCDIHYTVKAQVGGKIAQLGQRLIDGVAKSMADDFFKRFDQEMQRRYPEAYHAASQDAQADAAPAHPAASGSRPVLPAWAWGVAVALALVAGYLATR